MVIIYIPLVLLSFSEASVDPRVLWFDGVSRGAITETLADVHYRKRSVFFRLPRVAFIACFIWILMGRSRFYLVLVDAIFSTHIFLHCTTPMVSFLISDDLCINDVRL